MRNSILGLIAISIAMMLSGCGSAKDDPIIPISTNTRTIQTQQVNEVRNAMTNVDASLVAYQRATSASDIQAQTNALTLMASSLEQLTTAVRVAQPYLDYSLYRAVADQMGRIDQAGMQNVQVMAQMAQVEIITAVGFLRTSRAQLQSTTDRLSVLDRSMAATNARLNVIESGTTTSVDKVRLLVLAEVARLTSSDTAIQNRITTVTNSLTTAIADNTRLIAQNSSNTAAQLLSINSSLTNIIDQNNAQGLINTSTTRAIEAMRAVIGEQISQEVAKLQANINANHSTLTARIDLLQQAVDVLQTTTVISIVSSLNAHVITQGVVNSSLSSSILSLQTSLTNYIASSILSLSNSLSATSSTVNARIDQLHSIVGALRNEDYQLAVLISSLTSRVTSNSTTTQSQISLIQAELLNLNAHRLSILAQVARLSSTDAAIQSRITTVTNTLITAIADNIRLIAQNSSSTAAQLLSINSSLTSIIAQNNAQGLINSSTTRAIEAMRMAISAQITQEVAKLQTNINANHSTLTARIDLLQQAIDVLQTTTVISIINSLNAHVITQGVVNSSLTASILSLQASLTNYITSSILSLSTSLTVTSSTINARIDQLNWVIGGLVSEDARLALVIAGLTSSITSSLNNSSNQISILQAQVAQLTASVSALQALHRTPDVPIGTPTNVAGKAVDGLVIGGTVRVYTINESDYSPNILIGSTKTDSNGAFSVTLYGLTATQILLYEVSGGYYIEEWTQQRFDLRTGDKLYAIDRVETTSGTANVSITISGFTNLTYALALYRKNHTYIDSSLRIRPTISQARDYATPIVNLVLGGVNAEKTVFKDITSSDYAVSKPQFASDVDSFWYSFYVSGVSGLMASESVKQGANFYSIDFWKALYDDVLTDGVIDGKGINLKQIGIGIRPLEPDMLRTEAMRFANQFKTSKLQHIRFDTNGHSSFEQKMNIVHSSTDPIFGKISASPLDGDPPIIKANPIAGAITTNHVVVTISDASSITSMIYSLLDSNNTELSRTVYDLLNHSGGNAYKLSVDLNQTSGIYKMVITASDGHLLSRSTVTFSIVNDAPKLSITSSTRTTTGTITIHGSYSLPYPQFTDIQSISISDTVNGMGTKQAIINTGTKTFTSSFSANSSGLYTIDIKVCDTIGNCHTYVIKRSVDKDSPRIFSSAFGQGAGLKQWYISPSLGYQAFWGRINPYFVERTVSQLKISGAYDRISSHLFSNGNYKLGATIITERELDQANINYYAFNADDTGLPASTPLDDLVIKLKYSTASYNAHYYKSGPSSYTSIPPTSKTITIVKETTMSARTFATALGTKSKRVIIPLTTEFWGNSLIKENLFTTHIFEISVCDKAGLCTTKTFGLLLAIESPTQKSLNGSLTTLQKDLNFLQGVTPLVNRKRQMGGEKQFYKYSVKNTEVMPLFINIGSINSVATLTRTFQQKTVLNVPEWNRSMFAVRSVSCSDPDVTKPNTTAVTQISLKENFRVSTLLSKNQPDPITVGEPCKFRDFDGRTLYSVTTSTGFHFTDCSRDQGYYTATTSTYKAFSTTPTNTYYNNSSCSYRTPYTAICQRGSSKAGYQDYLCTKHHTHTRTRQNGVFHNNIRPYHTTKTVSVPYVISRYFYNRHVLTSSTTTIKETTTDHPSHFNAKLGGLDFGISTGSSTSWFKIPPGETIEFFDSLLVNAPSWHDNNGTDLDNILTEGVYRKDISLEFNYKPTFVVKIKRADDINSLTTPLIEETSDNLPAQQILLK